MKLICFQLNAPSRRGLVPFYVHVVPPFTAFPVSTRCGTVFPSVTRKAQRVGEM